MELEGTAEKTALPQESSVGTITHRTVCAQAVSYEHVTTNMESPDVTMLFPLASDMGFNHTSSDGYEPYAGEGGPVPSPSFCSVSSMLSP